MSRSGRDKKTWRTVAAVGAGATALGIVALAVRSSRRREASPPNKRIALIGDSYAVGLGPHLRKSLQNQNEFQYEGHVGTSTATWATRAPACGRCGDWLKDFEPGLVLVSLGVNDGQAPNPANYQAIVRELHGLGARVVWIEPPAGVVAAAPARGVIGTLGVKVVPGPSLPLRADGVHPQSYGAWAQEIAEESVRA